MKKNGFTLIEVLTVIIILAFIAVMVYPVMGKIIAQSKQSSLEEQIRSIEASAKKWGVVNTELLPDSIGDEYLLKLSDLKQTSYYENKDVVNPVTNERLNGCIHIKMESDGTHWSYTYVDEDIECGE